MSDFVGPSAAPPEGLLGCLFPDFVHGALAACSAEVSSPFPAENEVVANAGTRRRVEFLSARACAHAALRGLGRDEGPVGVGQSRQPIWPPGVVGSISHGGGWCAAVVASSSHVRGLGLDIEPLEPPLSAAVENLVLTATERSLLVALPHDLASLVSKVIFSAKECIYKAIFPSTGRSLGPGDIMVGVDLETGCFTARLVSWESGDAGRLGALHGRFVSARGCLVSGICLQDDGADPGGCR